MDEPAVDPTPPTTVPDAPPTNGLEMWTPRGIGWASVFLGFPGAVVLAALNWRRMGRTRKAILHLAAAVIGTWALYFVGWSIVLVGGLVVGYYLYRAQRSDQSPFAAAGGVTERSGWTGALIAFVASMLIILPGVLIEFAAVAGEDDLRDLRGEVLFFNAYPTSCSPTGHLTVFGPADPIFLTAVMREKVQAGSHVVTEVIGPGLTGGPIRVKNDRFDCLLGAQQLPWHDPGTYVVRYRYDGQPGTPDLAIGTFTITAGPAGSPSP
jgi:hypothetical protein